MKATDDEDEVHPLRLARCQRNWTQQQLAARAKVSVTTLWRAEHDHPISAESRQRLCACLKKTSLQLGLAGRGKELPISSPTPQPAHPVTQVALLPAPTQIVPFFHSRPNQALDLLLEQTDATPEQQVGAWLALEASQLGELFAHGWSLEQILESLQVVLQGVQGMPAFTRRELLKLGGAAILNGIPLPEGKRLSEEERAQLTRALSESISLAWKRFQFVDTAQTLIVGHAQLSIIQKTHALLHPSARSFLYAGTYSLIGLALHFQERDEEALQAHHSASIAALATGDLWYVAQSLICQSDSHHALGDFALAIQLIEEALRVIGKPSSNALVCARSHLLTCWADNAMTLRDYKTAQQKLDEAAQYLDHIAPNEEFDRAGWLLLAGKYARLTRNHTKAARCFEAALAALPEQWVVRRAMTATGLAMAYAQMRELDQSLTVAESLVPMLQTIDASMTNRWFSEYLQEDLLGLFPTEKRIQTFVSDTYHRLPQLAPVLAARKE